MRLDVNDTIAAIASAQGSSLRGIIRVSGPQTLSIFERLIQNGQLKVVGSDQFNFGGLSKACCIEVEFSFGRRQSVSANILVWPTKLSFTRQPSAEIHTIGASPLLQKILEQLFSSGCRSAEPGEFTMRAFLSGRIDLTQAEAVLGLIDARNQKQFDASISQLAGGIGGPMNEIRSTLMMLLAELEAGLDFVEEDIEFVSEQHIEEVLLGTKQKLTNVAEQLLGRQSGQQSPTVVLAGRANAGKSSLFNRLTDGRAIVSEIAGTTRDYLQAEIALNGMTIQLIDTAGLQVALDADIDTIEAKMSQQSKQQIRSADVVLVCVEQGLGLGELEDQLMAEAGPAAVLVRTKVDLANDHDDQESGVSSLTGQGIDWLKEAIVERIQRRDLTDTAVPATVARIQDSLMKAAEAVDSAWEAARMKKGEEIVATEIRITLEHLGMIVGVVYTDDILDLVFSQFCIGK